MENKNITNDFSAGMTNIPSDNICPDESVAIEWNMIYRNGEHQPIQAPRDLDIFKTGSFYILHVHKVSKEKHYIGVSDNGNLVYCTEGKDTVTISEYSDYNEQTQVTSIGNTLVVNVTGKELRYFLWKPDDMAYKFIGNKLPKPKIEFVLANTGTTTTGAQKRFSKRNTNYSSYEGILEYSCVVIPTTGNRYCLANIIEHKEEDAKSLFIGLYSKCKNDASKNKSFCNPFMIRYAIMMFDGNYINISTPIIMMPSIQSNSVFSIDTPSHPGSLICDLISYPLFFKFSEDLSEWRDIIKNISIFITNQIDVYDTSEIKTHTPPYQDSINSVFTIKNEEYVLDTTKYKKTTYENTGELQKIIRNSFEIKSNEQIIYEISTLSTFYKLFEIDIKGNDKWETSEKLIRDNTIENITTAEQLDHDDYFSNCPLTAESIYMYNKRLHLSNVSRGFFNGGTSFLPLHTIEYPIVDRVQIKTAEGVRVVLNKYYTRENPSIYFYYPDPRAFHVDRCVEQPNGNLAIISVGGTKCSFDLKTHPFLNGAYYMRDTLPSETDNLEWSSPSDITRSEVTDESFNKESVDPENLSNEVWVSEVNNPFVFYAQGVNTVGNGSIIGVISNTRAISQGQFGQFPLFCFTTDGIWMLETSSEGIYSASTPMSREICNNKNSITATDNLVFFTSEKGLMMINGADITCVSSQLSGKTYEPIPHEVQYAGDKIDLGIPFLRFLKNCKIAYDYRDNLLWITNPESNLCYILSIDSGTFALTTLSYPVANVINDYPDNIMLYHDTDENYYPYSLIDRENINDDSRRINGFIFSRPMKLGDSLTLKSPVQIRLIDNMNDKAVKKLRLFASDDLRNWVRLTSLRGRGFKYFKYNLIFENMLPTDTLGGIASTWQYRFMPKFR